ncbi:MAG: hypothetical protein ACREKE_04485, partial [bacterium]
YQYWPNALANLPENGVWSSYVNDMTSWAAKNPNVTTTEMQERGLKLLASYFNQNPQVFNEAAANRLQQTGAPVTSKNIELEGEWMQRNEVQNLRSIMVP